MTMFCGVCSILDHIAIAFLENREGMTEPRLLGEKVLAYTYDTLENLMTEIQGFAAELELDLSHLSAIGIVNGPGSYTGVRLTVTVAKSMAQVMSLPLYPMSTFDLMMKMAIQDGMYITAMPARKNELNVQLFGQNQGDVSAKTDPMIWSYSHFESVLSRFEEPVTVLTYSNALFQAFCQGLQLKNVRIQDLLVSARPVAEYAAQNLSENIKGDYQKCMPLYSQTVSISP